MAFTLTQLTQLRAAIAQGATRVEYNENGRSNSVVYRSLDEMLLLERRMMQDLGMLPSGGGAKPIYPIYRKGV